MKKNLFIIYTLSFITFLNSSTYRNCSSVEELRKMSDILKDQKPCFDITALLEKGFVTINDFFDEMRSHIDDLQRKKMNEINKILKETNFINV